MKIKIKFLLQAGLLLLLCGALTVALVPQSLIDFYTKTASVTLSGNIPFHDFNKNGVTDSEDILAGTRLDAENMPEYDGSYYENGYPPDDIGVCTDVIWRAFRFAGYSLRKMVDLDIKSRPEAYPNISEPDDNIDFRRVVNLRIFFDTHAISLSTDPSESDQWQPGDIVIFKNSYGKPSHIGIISNKRTADGRPYVIHNSGQAEREEDILLKQPIIGHYRFDATKIDEALLLPWDEADENDLPVKG